MRKSAQIHITGIVQGVGFRPFIYNLASQMGLFGWVRNTSSGVDIEIEGEIKSLDTFVKAIKNEAPELARIETLEIQYGKPNGFDTFEIIQSEVIHGAFLPISGDISICSDCLHELFDPNDRRYLYPFINCTNCGPRFTIIEDIPYDRPFTTMDRFQLCPECEAEYRDPSNRRFHAQPVACPVCGPNVWLEFTNSRNETSHTEARKDLNQGAAIITTQTLLGNGKIVAIKGIGGFHLACDATNSSAVEELRNRKLRVDKPFALMMANMEVVRHHCYVDLNEAKLLESKERPIVILKRKAESNIVAEIAPNQSTLGVMLPYTPLHYLLFSGPAPRKNDLRNGTAKIPQVLVMTSGNLREEPLAIDNEDARNRLSPLSDAILMHNRDICTRCDDSVVRIFPPVITDISKREAAETVFPLRRSRGYAPFPIHLLKVVTPVLAVGGELKNTFCLTKNNYAFLSHHIGDMENFETLLSFEDGIKHFEKLFRIYPSIIAHDLHPDYLSTRYALDRSLAENIPIQAIQHHHAHIAACMIDNGISEQTSVFGVAFDGTGYGDDGGIWGGEFFLADYKSYHRVAHLEYMPLPGGDTAIKHPARTALAYLWKTGISWESSPNPFNAFNEEERLILRSQLDRQINTPRTSSVGRLFDAVSAIVGVRQHVNYEAQAAIELEMLIDKSEKNSYQFEIDSTDVGSSKIIRLSSIIEAIIDDIQRNIAIEIVSARFHNTISKIVFETIMAMRNMYGNYPVVLSGGVWQNVTLLYKTIELFRNANVPVYIHRQVPTNDGGISLGQALVAISIMND